ncbi:MAG: type IV secretion system protein DotC [Micavibrio sp.]|mgnify:CR=1 FL=1|nr:type IV secretion system protein DotC [Micavibrio sp.]
MKPLFVGVFAVLFSFGVSISMAQAKDSINPPPPSLKYLQDVKPKNEKDLISGKPQAPNIRRDAIKNAALSYGARGGLARRTYEIRQELKGKGNYMDRTYDFSRLLIKGPSGVFIEPPTVTEGQDAFIVENEGQTAAIAEVLYNINQKAKIVGAPRNWRTYLEREWGEVTPPPDLLLPKDYEERVIWRENVEKGWEEGYLQGDDIFQADLDRLNRDFTGMVRYRLLLKQNIISAPFALLEERGVTGGGNELRIGDRAVQITGPSQLQARPEEWQPVNR